MELEIDNLDRILSPEFERSVFSWMTDDTSADSNAAHVKMEPVNSVLEYEPQQSTQSIVDMEMMLKEMKSMKTESGDDVRNSPIVPRRKESTLKGGRGTPVKRKRTYMTAACPLCHKVFFRKYEMMRHLKATHLQMKPFHCHMCTGTFSRKTHLKLHLKKIHNSIYSESDAASSPSLSQSPCLVSTPSPYGYGNY